MADRRQRDDDRRRYASSSPSQQSTFSGRPRRRLLRQHGQQRQHRDAASTTTRMPQAAAVMSKLTDSLSQTLFEEDAFIPILVRSIPTAPYVESLCELKLLSHLMGSSECLRGSIRTKEVLGSELGGRQSILLLNSINGQNLFQLHLSDLQKTFENPGVTLRRNRQTGARRTFRFEVGVSGIDSGRVLLRYVFVDEDGREEDRRDGEEPVEWEIVHVPDEDNQVSYSFGRRVRVAREEEQEEEGETLPSSSSRIAASVVDRDPSTLLQKLEETLEMFQIPQNAEDVPLRGYLVERYDEMSEQAIEHHKRLLEIVRLHAVKIEGKSVLAELSSLTERIRAAEAFPEDLVSKMRELLEKRQEGRTTELTEETVNLQELIPSCLDACMFLTGFASCFLHWRLSLLHLFPLLEEVQKQVLASPFSSAESLEAASALSSAIWQQVEATRIVEESERSRTALLAGLDDAEDTCDEKRSLVHRLEKKMTRQRRSGASDDQVRGLMEQITREKSALERLEEKEASLKRELEECDRVIATNTPMGLPYLSQLRQRTQSLSEFERRLMFHGCLVNRTMADYTNLQLRRAANGFLYQAKLKGDFLDEWRVVKLLPFDEVHKRKTMNEVEVLLSVQHPAVIRPNAVFVFDDDRGKAIGIEYDFYRTDLLFWLKGEQFRQFDEDFSYADLLAQPTVREPNAIRLVLRKVLEGLVRLHELGIEHRDLKPEHVMLNSVNDLVIIDFGTSKLEAMETVTILRGQATERYAPPEGQPSKKGDVYSFGKMAMEALGQPAHVDLTVEVFLTTASSYLGEMELDLLRRMLDEDPQTRISSVDCLRHAYFCTESSEVRIGLSELKSERVSSLRALFTSWIAPSRALPQQRLVVQRGNVFNSLIAFVAAAGNLEELMAPLRTVLEGEAGVDEGGVTREMFLSVAKEILESEMVTTCSGNFCFLRDDVLAVDQFRMLGRLLCRCVLEGRKFRLPLGPFCWAFVLGQLPTSYDAWVSFAECYDRTLVKNIVCAGEAHVLEELSRFADCFDYVDQEGREQPLTRANQKDFVLWNLKQFLLGKRHRRRNLEALRHGFFELLTQDQVTVIGTMASCVEMEHMVYGSHEITAEVLLANIDFPIRPQVVEQALRRWVNETTNALRCQFVQFVTGF